MWLVRFAPYEGAVIHQLGFRTEESAKECFDAAVAHSDQRDLVMTFTDDFGQALAVIPSECAALMVSTETDASFVKALNTDTEEAAQTYGLGTSQMRMN